jgi:ectoine hydroxylase-related dioxygenase (phytanoyl-CoA dioxygenase family)
MTSDFPNVKVAKVPANAGTEALLEAYHRDGGVIILGLLSTEQVSKINAELDPLMDHIDAGTKEGSDGEKAFFGHNTKRLTNIVTHSKTFREEVLDNSVLHDVTQATLSKGVDFPTYWLNTTQVIQIGPKSPPQYLHRDFYYPLLPRDGPEVMNNILIALSDYKEIHGATRVIPGSHLWDDLEDTGTFERTVPAEMEPGDALWICGNVVHGGGANQTEDFYRRALSFSFCNNSLTPEEAIQHLVPLKVAKTLSKRGQQMIGFRSQPTKSGMRVYMADFKELATMLGLDE